jgi:16S rRNA processing protein RimM
LKKSECTYIGRLIKPHGVRGELSCKLEPAYVPVFLKQKFLFIEVYPDDDLVPFYAEESEADPAGNARVKFEDCDNIKSLELVVGKNIFVHNKELGKFKVKLPKQEPGVLGYRVIDKLAGEIGTISEIISNPKQQTLVVRKNEAEVLIPFVKEFVLKTDKAQKVIFMMIPEGLLGIND